MVAFFFAFKFLHGFFVSCLIFVATKEVEACV